MCKCREAAEHEHNVDDDNLCGTSVSLHSYVDFKKCLALNVKRDVDLRIIIRPKFAIVPNSPLISDADAQIIVKIQYYCRPQCLPMAIDFLAQSKFVNVPDLDFSIVESQSPTQTWALVRPDSRDNGLIRYPTKTFKFQNVNHLTLFFPGNFGDAETLVSFIGLYGEFSQTRIGVVNATYEAKPMASDHKTETQWMNAFRPGF